jgi:dihydropyrimidinase
MYDVVVRNGLVIYPEKTLLADLGISGGKIKSVSTKLGLNGKRSFDAENCYVLPGVIDPHTHPVYLDDLGDLSKTAVFGGVTTLVHYAYARPGNSLVQIIEQYRERGEQKSCIDFALHGGLFETLKQADEIPKAFDLGVTSFKVFMSYAKLGWMTDDYAMAKCMEIVGGLGGMVSVHAETGLAIDYIMDRMIAAKVDFAEQFLDTSPDVAEAEGIFRAVSIGRLMNCPVYIPHISSAEGIDIIRFLKSKGIRVFGETCPQYLGLTWDAIKPRGPLGKVGPSIKTERDRLALWDAVRSGLIDTFGSDHAPKDKKVDDDFFKAPYGSPEVETMLPVIWDCGVNSGFITPNQVVSLLSERTSRIMGLFPQKGRIDPDSDADLVIFDPSHRWTVTAENQHSNAAYSLFEGRELLGRVRTVLSSGELVVDGEEFLGKPGMGRFLATKAGRYSSRT